MANGKRIRATFTKKAGNSFKQLGFDLPVIIMRENGSVISQVPFFYITTQGKSVEESIENLKDAVELYFDGEDVEKLVKEKMPMPSPSIEIMKMSSEGKVLRAPFISVRQ